MASIVERLFGLSGKTALVTGGTSGIGRMIAEAYVSAGARVFVVGRKPEAVNGIAAEIAAQPIAGDVGTQAGCQAIARAFQEQGEGELHVLVNGAGATWGAPIEDYPDVAWDKLNAINVKGVFQLTTALLPALKTAASADDPSRVINIGSVHGVITPEFESYAYSATKAGLHHLTRHLARRLGREHILVNAIAPGPFPSRMMASMIAAHEEELKAQSATGRLGRDDDMAGVALYLAGRGAANVTGAVLPVDGGYGTTR
jgi:NAD(P)-dependent dehydrogenase (short-subunit alcohol dehydrogenase family)